jgi:hypothetical protein
MCPLGFRGIKIIRKLSIMLHLTTRADLSISLRFSRDDEELSKKHPFRDAFLSLKRKNMVLHQFH